MLYLASQSPRRREILQQIGVPFEPVHVSVDETPAENESPADYVRRMALGKASVGFEAVAPLEPKGAVVLGADTIVVLDGQILGKPRDHHHAGAMLKKLSGREHQVLSAVALVSGGKTRDDLSTTQVSFRPLSPGLIESYWHTGEPADKAGAYGIQGLGAVFVQGIQGSYSGVVGLPIENLVPLLEAFGIHYWQ